MAAILRAEYVVGVAGTLGHHHHHPLPPFLLLRLLRQNCYHFLLYSSQFPFIYFFFIDIFLLLEGVFYVIPTFCVHLPTTLCQPVSVPYSLQSSELPSDCLFSFYLAHLSRSQRRSEDSIVALSLFFFLLLL